MRTGLSGDWIFSYLRWFHGAAERTMVSTDFLKADLTARGFEHLVIRPLGVDTELFQRNIDIPPSKKPIFMFLGRLAAEKGIDDFLTCKLPGEKWIVGDGPERMELETLHPEVRFFGYKTGQDLVDILSRATVLVFPSRTETFGLVVLEALSCGVPVAAYPAPGPSYIISSGVDGVLGENLEKAAIECVSLDSAKCREKALSYSWEHSAESFLSYLVPVDSDR